MAKKAAPRHWQWHEMVELGIIRTTNWKYDCCSFYLVHLPVSAYLQSCAQGGVSVYVSSLQQRANAKPFPAPDSTGDGKMGKKKGTETGTGEERRKALSV